MYADTSNVENKEEFCHENYTNKYYQNSMCKISN